MEHQTTGLDVDSLTTVKISPSIILKMKTFLPKEQHAGNGWTHRSNIESKVRGGSARLRCGWELTDQLQVHFFHLLDFVEVLWWTQEINARGMFELAEVVLKSEVALTGEKRSKGFQAAKDRKQEHRGQSQRVTAGLTFQSTSHRRKAFRKKG